MSKVKCQISVSADGFLAGPNQSEEHGLGEGGEGLHEWAFKLRYFQEIHGREGGEGGVSDELLREASADVGAEIMGRNMFGPVRGPWSEPLWNGWAAAARRSSSWSASASSTSCSSTRSR